jgi:hypothetical protein
MTAIGCAQVLKRINRVIEARRAAGEDLPPPPKVWAPVNGWLGDLYWLCGCEHGQVAFPQCSSSRKVSGLIPIAVFALATPKSVQVWYIMW